MVGDDGTKREALKKAAISLSTSFNRGLRPIIEDQYAKLGTPLTEEEKSRMRSMGIDPDDLGPDVGDEKPA